MTSVAGLFEVTAIDIVLLVLFIYVVYKLFFKKYEVIEPPTQEKVEPLEKRDMTIEQLKRYNGVDDEHICFALLGNIYDVTKGKDFYGPQAAYGVLAGHDATRALGTMNLKLVKDGYDDHSGMTADDLEEAKEWEHRLSCVKYPLVGRLLPPEEEEKEIEETEKVSEKVVEEKLQELQEVPIQEEKAQE
ncbi:Cytochrome b5 heme-binding domain-containing protein [Meloidogyne graminicola]|uniref:Cytochrome b5 heme-binding domain-containing protein n=1 Tax=Meloidogyne graminicola TaxID=189291 RepID=A0A8S9ZUM1_9BILA|nr:Cytochrome b5 heme-binding domain-containing protein [Meloidogyne graminicola]